MEPEEKMHTLRTILLAAAAIGGLTATAAALPLNDRAVQGASPVQNAAVICDDRGRCVHTRRHAREFYRDQDYDYGPPAYGFYEPGPGVDFRFGAGRHHWWR
jgi:hypothetical protein